MTKAEMPDTGGDTMTPQLATSSRRSARTCVRVVVDPDVSGAAQAANRGV
jgi:hypothetical protein